MDFDLRLLRCALTLAEHRNFVRAAKSLHISQPTLSRSIQELEQRAGTRLFDRTSIGVEPTDTGRLFLDRARDIMSCASDLGREMDLLRGLDRGELRVGCGTYPSVMYVDRALARLIAQHPSVRMSVVNDNWANLLPLLRRRELDLAIIDVTAVESEPEMRVSRLQNHQGYLVLRSGHPLLKVKDADQVAESWNFPFVATSRFPPDVFRELAAVLLGSRKTKIPGSKTLVSVACESLHMMKNIVLESDAVTILPLHLVIDEVNRGELVAITGPSWLRGNFGVVHLAERSLSPLGETFVRLVKEADAELLAWEERIAKGLFRPRRVKTKAASA